MEDDNEPFFEIAKTIHSIVVIQYLRQLLDDGIGVLKLK